MICPDRIDLCLENTDNPNSPHAQRVLRSEPKTWQESLLQVLLSSQSCLQANHVLCMAFCWITFLQTRPTRHGACRSTQSESTALSLAAYSSTSRIGLCFQCHSDDLGDDWPDIISSSTVDQPADIDCYWSLHPGLDDLPAGHRQATNHREEMSSLVTVHKCVEKDWRQRIRLTFRLHLDLAECHTRSLSEHHSKTIRLNGSA